MQPRAARWWRRAKTHEVDADTLHSLVVTKTNGEETLTHITRSTGAPTHRTILTRGRSEDGCLKHITTAS